MPTPTQLLRYLKASMGSLSRVLPINDDEIMEIVYQDTLPTYSSFFPYIKQLTVNATYDTTEEQGIYRIRFEEGLKLLQIIEVLREPLNGSTGSYYPPVYDAQTVFEAQAAQDIYSMVSMPTVARFIPPDKVEVFPKYNYTYDFMLRAGFEHPRHFQTIGENMFLQFRQLALYDVKSYVYEAYLPLDGISTAYGNIDLKLDSYANAKDDRKTLLEDFEKRFLQHPSRKKIIVI